MILTIVVGIIVLSVLIIVHELGHFIASKATGCWVEEFGIGFPPRLYGKKWGDTIYSINWIPFGGFNRISGEVDPEAPRALAARGYGVRLLVISGGIIMNLLLPFVLLAAAYMVPHDMAYGKIVVDDIEAGTPAAEAGMLPGDTLLAVNGRTLNYKGDYSRALMLNMGSEITISLERADGTPEDVYLTVPWRPTEAGRTIGTLSHNEDLVIGSESLLPWEAIPVGARNCIEALVLYKNGIYGMIIGTVPFIPAGPVGIVQVTGEVAHAGISPVLELAAFISIAIAITQIIPFPALDGGRLIFIVLEWIRRGKRVSARVEGFVHSIGFMILLALLVLITYQDIVRWISGESLMG
ncbi:MAG: site-2 protease family protein [Dehalococcoidales bacterium]|nr:site-2 protease family protein [Dehalococcoidales bacterium]